MNEPAYFRVCSTCRKPIAFESRYYSCSVSTCNRKPTALFFCSVPCWDAHVPDARHKDAWAIEESAPTRAAFVAERDGTNEPRRRVVSTLAHPGATHEKSPASPGEPDDLEGDPLPSGLPEDVLIVVSKLKAYVKARSQMNTSDGVFDVLSEHLRRLSGRAIESAAKNSRKTVLARDFEAVLRGTIARE